MGRKALYESGMIPVTSRIPSELAEAFKLMAEANGNSVSMQLRRLIEDWVDAQDPDAMIEARKAELEASNDRLRNLALRGRRPKEDLPHQSAAGTRDGRG